MSYQDFEDIRIVGDVHTALQKMSNYLGEHCAVVLSKEAEEKWKALEEKHRKFYDMSIQERLVYSGINKEV